MKQTLSILAALLATHSAFSQNQGEKDFHVYTSVSVGFSFQSFTDVFFIDRKYPRVTSSLGLDGESNAEGFGVPIAFTAHAPNINIGIRYEPILRYDVIKPALPYSGNGDRETDQYGFFADHHFSVYRQFWLWGTKNNLMGIGYSFISRGQSYKRDWSLVYASGRVVSGSSVDLSFSGIHALYAIKVAHRLWAECKIMYIPKHRIIYEYDLASLMFTIEATYEIPLGKFRQARL